MNSLTKQIMEDLDSLPIDMQQESLNFVRSLKGQLAHRSQNVTNGEQVVEVMTRIAKRGTAFKQIEDPITWQREIRKDRPLPERDA